MRTTTTTRSLILGAVVAGTLTLGAVQGAFGDDAPAAGRPAVSDTPSARTAPERDHSDAPPTRTVRERGFVLEGTGTWRGQPVSVYVYENQKHGNSLQIVVGDPDGEHAIAAGEGRDAYVIDGVLDVGLDVDGDLAVVKGTVTADGDPEVVTESAPDGDLVSSTGERTPLLVDATFAYRGETVDLTFPEAFAFDLRSERTVD